MIRKQIVLSLAVLSTCAATNVIAAPLQIGIQDVVGLANSGAGRAASAEDASTAFYNPAGIPFIQNQQLVAGGIGLSMRLKYKGTAAVNTLGGTPDTANTSSNTFTPLPFFHYVAPISNTIGFGLSLAAPAGLKLNYGHATPLQYATYQELLQVVDLSPAIGVMINPQFSLGFGLDVEKMHTRLSEMFTAGAGTDSISINKGSDTAYGYHLGALYQISSTSRLGLNYRSQIVHHLNGDSKFLGPLANVFNGGPIVSRAHSTITLPPATTLSAYHKLGKQWAIMGTAIYTQWNIVQPEWRWSNIAGISGVAPTSALSASIPQHYRNTWDFAIGADYVINDKITLRSGLGYDQTPTTNAYRNVELPDSNNYTASLGGHYQATKTVGIDVGWSHYFATPALISSLPQQRGNLSVSTNGKVNGNHDLIGAQIIWDML